MSRELMRNWLLSTDLIGWERNYFHFSERGQEFDQMLKKILYAEEGPVHATLEEFVNEILSLRWGLPSTLVPHENGAFQNRNLVPRAFSPGQEKGPGNEVFKTVHQTRGIWKCRLCIFLWTENILKAIFFESDVAQ